MSLKIKFINTNTENEIVQAMSGVLAYNIMNRDENVMFDYSKSNARSHKIHINEYEELEM